LGSVRYIFFIEINTFIQQRCIKLIKCDSKDIYNGTKYFFGERMFIKESLFPWNYLAAKTLHNTDVSWAANLHIRTSEGSCDTEDWSNDAKNL